LSARRACLYLLISLIWACGRTTGLPPVDLSQQTNQTSRRVEQLRVLEQNLTDNLEKIEELETRFFDPKLSFDPPFPRDLFRHASMACVTEPPWQEVEPESEVAVVATKLGLTCHVRPLPDLESALSNVSPSNRQAAVNALQSIDNLRLVKAEIELGLREAPQVVQDVLDFIALGRADLRQLENELRRRRPEYTNADFALSSNRIEDTRRRFDELQEYAERMSATLENRNERLMRVLQTTYRGIALLGEP